MGFGLTHLNNIYIVGLLKNQYAGVGIGLKHSSPVSINFKITLVLVLRTIDYLKPRQHF